MNKILFTYLLNTLLKLKIPFALHFFKLLDKKNKQNADKNYFTTNERMFGAKDSLQARKFSQPLVSMVETFRRSEEGEEREEEEEGEEGNTR